MDFYWNSQAWVLKYEPKGLGYWRVSPAYPELGIGVNGAVADLDGDGIGEILTGPGPGFLSEPWVKIFRPDGTLIRKFLGQPVTQLHPAEVLTTPQVTAQTTPQGYRLVIPVMGLNARLGTVVVEYGPLNLPAGL